MNTIELSVETGEPGRLDSWLAGRLAEMSRSRAQKLVESGQVLVDGQVVKSAHRLEPGMTVRVSIPVPQPLALAAEEIPLSIVHEDSDVIVIDKPAGLTVHPAPGHEAGTMVNALLAHCGDLAGIQGTLRPGIVHRLDKETSGLLMVAKNDMAQMELSRQLAEHRVAKVYLALVDGHPPEHGVIDAPIGRHPAQRKRMAIVAEGRPARTHFRQVTALGERALLVLALETGRTHQIRVHLAAAGYPVAGDRVYGHGDPDLGRQMLHAWRLGFHHPRDGSLLDLEAPLPTDLARALDVALRRLGRTGGSEAVQRLIQSARGPAGELAARAMARGSV